MVSWLRFLVLPQRESIPISSSPLLYLVTFLMRRYRPSFAAVQVVFIGTSST